jgi:hypothetical protein
MLTFIDRAISKTLRLYKANLTNWNAFRMNLTDTNRSFNCKIWTCTRWPHNADWKKNRKKMGVLNCSQSFLNLILGLKLCNFNSWLYGTRQRWRGGGRCLILRYNFRHLIRNIERIKNTQWSQLQQRFEGTKSQKAFQISIHYASKVSREKVTKNDVSRMNGRISWEMLFHNRRRRARTCLRSYRYILLNEFSPFGPIMMSSFHTHGTGKNYWGRNNILLAQ